MSLLRGLATSSVCVYACSVNTCTVVHRASSGVAGPLAARGGGQICRPFVLGFVDVMLPKKRTD